MENDNACMPLVDDHFVPLARCPKQFNGKDYTLIKELDDPRFSLLQVIETSPEKKMAYVKQRELNLSFDKLEELKFRSQLSNSNLLDIYGYTLKNELKDICIYFEPFESDFEQEIQQALRQKQIFSEENLYSVLSCALSALSYLQEQNTFHQCITPTQILKVGGGYKLHDNFLIAKEKSLLQQGLRHQDLRYIAPEILAAISNGETERYFNFFKADVYSLGICILDAGVLTETDLTLIDRKELKVIKENLESRIRYFASRYSLGLSELLQEMLCLDPEIRPDPIQLHSRTNPTKLIGNQRGFLTPYSKSNSEETAHNTRKITFKKRDGSTHKQHSDRSDANIAHLQNKDFLMIQAFNDNHHLETSELPHPTRQTSASSRKENESQISTPTKSQLDLSHTKISSPIKNDPILSKIIQKMYSRFPTNENDFNSKIESAKKTEPQAQTFRPIEVRTPLQKLNENVKTFFKQTI